MNTVQVQLTEKQYDAMMGLLDCALRHIEAEQNFPSCEKDEEEAEALLADHDEVSKELISTKTYLWTSNDGVINLEIPAEAVDDIAQSGDNEPAVTRWMETPSYLQKQMLGVPIQDIGACLTDAGFDLDAKTVWEMRKLLLWMACWDIHEERYMED